MTDRDIVDELSKRASAQLLAPSAGIMLRAAAEILRLRHLNAAIEDALAVKTSELYPDLQAEILRLRSAPQVTEEMVERANAAIWKVDNWTASYNGMRAALTAALTPGGGT